MQMNPMHESCITFSTALRQARIKNRGATLMDGTILVVEHELTIRELLAANLDRAGYRVFCANGIGEADQLVRAVRPDLVVLDWMPGSPGLALARQLRSDPRTAGVSII